MHNRAWKSAASVMISGNHAESIALLSAGSMAPASTQWNLRLVSPIAINMQMERKKEFLRTVMDQLEHIGFCLDWKGKKIGWRSLRRIFRGPLGALEAQALGRRNIYLGAVT